MFDYITYKEVIVVGLGAIAWIVYCVMIYNMVKKNSPNTWDK